MDIATEPEEFDPWALPELKDTGTPWNGTRFCIYNNYGI